MKRIIISLISIFISTTTGFSQKEKFYSEQSVSIDEINVIEEVTAKSIYNYFKTSTLFDWSDYNNCEDRANAIGILLDSWNLPNYKAWVFSGGFLEKDNGKLTDRYGVRWKYHVAACIPIKINEKISLIVIDPSTTQEPLDVSYWANNVTDTQFGYYFITEGKKYIWKGKGKNIGKDTFFDRNSTNYEYTIQGLAGFNGLNGKHRRMMKKQQGKDKLKNTEDTFNLLKNNKPEF
jgi:hypothetical protein